MPDAQGLRLNLIGNDYAPVASVKEPEIDLWEVSVTAFICSLTLLFEVLLISTKAEPGWLWGVLGVGALIGFVGVPAGTIYKQRKVCSDFHERARR